VLRLSAVRTDVTLPPPARPAPLSRVLENHTTLGVLMVAPAVLILAGLLAYPFLLGIYLSLTNAIIGRTGQFIGLGNYVSLLGDPLFRLATFNTFLYTIVACAFKLVLGLALAILLNREFLGKRFIRAIVLLPYIVPTVLSAISFWWIYDPTFGIISYTLQHLGLISYGIDFLGDPGLARAALIAANIWRGVPFYAIGLLAALQTVPASLFEAGAIDGAGRWGTFWHITMPLLTPITVVITMFSVILTFADFQLPWVITRGGPNNATQLYGTLAFQRAIQGAHMGEGAAVAMAIFPVLVTTVIVSFRYLRRDD
jgi:multiple sugar transport system permease protein